MAGFTASNLGEKTGTENSPKRKGTRRVAEGKTPIDLAWLKDRVRLTVHDYTHCGLVF